MPSTRTLRPPSLLVSRGTDTRWAGAFILLASICLLAARVGAEGVRDVPADVVRDLNRERVRHAARFVFASREAEARAAQATYAELRQAGEAHAVPFRFVVIEEGQFRDVSAEIIRERATGS